MCLVSFLWKQHEDHPLIVLANRDEFWDRPTAAAHWWEDHPDIWGGRDLQAGGTWMAMHKTHGRFAWITNYREPIDPSISSPSRGELIPKFLLSQAPITTFTAWIQTHGKDYQGFNLIYGDSKALWYFSNRLAEPIAQQLAPGLYGLSNHLLDTPWPKVQIANAQLLASSKHKQIDAIQMLNALTDKEKAEDERVPHTGVPFEMEKQLSPVFIDIPSVRYGTRVSTVLLMDKSFQLNAWEKTWQNLSIQHQQIDLTQPKVR